MSYYRANMNLWHSNYIIIGVMANNHITIVMGRGATIILLLQPSCDDPKQGHLPTRTITSQNPSICTNPPPPIVMGLHCGILIVSWVIQGYIIFSPIPWCELGFMGLNAHRLAICKNAKHFLSYRLAFDGGLGFSYYCDDSDRQKKKRGNSDEVEWCVLISVFPASGSWSIIP